MRDGEYPETATKRRTRWPTARVARAAFLCGSGLPPAEVAADPEVRATVPTVSKALNRAGVSFHDARRGRVTFDLPEAAHASWKRAAEVRRVDPDRLMRRLAVLLAADPALLDNVLDDGLKTPGA